MMVQAAKCRPPGSLQGFSARGDPGRLAVVLRLRGGAPAPHISALRCILADRATLGRCRQVSGEHGEVFNGQHAGRLLLRLVRLAHIFLFGTSDTASRILAELR